MGKFFVGLLVFILACLAFAASIVVAVNVLQAIFLVGGSYGVAIGWFIVATVCGTIAKIVATFIKD